MDVHLEFNEQISGPLELDENPLAQLNQKKIDASEFTILETWGPFPIQPVVIRAAVPISLKQSVHKSLLHAHEGYSAELNSFGFRWFTEATRQDYVDIR